MSTVFILVILTLIIWCAKFARSIGAPTDPKPTGEPDVWGNPDLEKPVTEDPPIHSYIPEEMAQRQRQLEYEFKLIGNKPPLPAPREEPPVNDE